MQRIRKKALWTAIAVSVAVVASLGGLLVGSSLFPGLLNHNATDKQTQGILFSGTETIKVIAPDGRIVSTWEGPDPLTNLAINAIASCATAGDAPGSTTSPVNFGSCSAWTNEMFIQWDSPAGVCSNGLDAQINSICSYSSAPTSDTLTPIGCNPSAYNPAGTYCTGWISEATFGPATFTPANCGTIGTSPLSCSLENVDTGTGALWQDQTSGICPRGTCTNYVVGSLFDTLCTTTYGQWAVDWYPVCTLTSPPATMSPGDSLLVTIQFTVS
jgi:hypothetical protein